MVTLATAHPAKFPDAVAGPRASDRRYQPIWPTFWDRPEHTTTLPNDLAKIEAFVAGG